MNTSISFTRVWHWFFKVGLAILDQGVFSGANYAFNILLARWLLPDQYGAYAVVFAAFQIGYQLQSATILEPMSVLGPAKTPESLTKYLKVQIKIHFILSLFIGAILVLVALIFFNESNNLKYGFIAMGGGLCFILLPWMLRRVFYVFAAPGKSALSSVIYAISLLTLAGIVYRTENLSVSWAITLYALSGMTSGYFLYALIPKDENGDVILFRDVLLGNWNYGKWLVLAAIFIAIAAQIQTFVVGFFLGLDDAGAFRAMQNFVQPAIISFSAISALLLPSLAFDFEKGNIERLKRRGRYLFTSLLIISISFYLFLIKYGMYLETVLYNGRFSSYINLIHFWGLVPFAGVITYSYYFLLQSIQQPKAIFIGSVIWSVISTSLSIYLTSEWGIAGTTASVVLGYLISGVAFAVLYWYHAPRKHFTSNVDGSLIS